MSAAKGKSSFMSAPRLCARSGCRRYRLARLVATARFDGGGTVGYQGTIRTSGMSMNPLLKRAVAAAMLAMLGTPVLAQSNDEAPAPPAVPIAEIGEEAISPAGGQTIEGMATVIDGDELRVGDSLIRLFGIA